MRLLYSQNAPASDFHLSGTYRAAQGENYHANVAPKFNLFSLSCSETMDSVGSAVLEKENPRPAPRGRGCLVKLVHAAHLWSALSQSCRRGSRIDENTHIRCLAYKLDELIYNTIYCIIRMMLGLRSYQSCNCLGRNQRCLAVRSFVKGPGLPHASSVCLSSLTIALQRSRYRSLVYSERRLQFTFFTTTIFTN